MKSEKFKSKKLKRLKEILRAQGRVAVAFSGGGDSAFLLKAACDLLGKENVLAVTADSEIFASRELKDSKELAKEIGVQHLIFRINSLKDIKFRKNPLKRCYHCKTILFNRIKQIAAQRGFSRILDGSNYDDKKDFRPGSRAAKEQKIISPLQEAGFTKEDIRVSSKKLGLSSWDKPSCACLASRVPYGEEITKKKLAAIETAEEFVRAGFKIRQVRVRYNYGDIARIEVEPDKIRRLFEAGAPERIAGRLKKLGFKYVTVDLRGYRGPCEK